MPIRWRSEITLDYPVMIIFLRTYCEQLCGVKENRGGVICKIPNLSAGNSAWQQAYRSIIRYKIRRGSYTIVNSYSLLRAGLGANYFRNRYQIGNASLRNRYRSGIERKREHEIQYF